MTLDNKNIKIDSKLSSRGIDFSLIDINFSPLNGTKEEAEHIKNIINDDEIVNIYTQEKATKENFLNISNTEILHCATHAFYIKSSEDINPLLKIGIAFSGANHITEEKYRPNIATGLEILSMKQLKGTSLIVLSTCQSAIGDIELSEGVMALNKIFIQIGSKAVISSLWKADDQETSKFFRTFYKKREEENDRLFELDDYDTPINHSKVLKETKIDFIKSKKHPLFWAGFLFYGI